MRSPVALGWGLVLGVTALAGCDEGQDPGSGGATASTTVMSSTSSDVASSSSGGPISCDKLVVDPVVQRPVGDSLVQFAAWPGASGDVALFTLESPPPEFGMSFPGDLWATHVFDAFGPDWPPNTLHEKRFTTDGITSRYLLDGTAAAPSILANGSILRDVLGSNTELPGVTDGRAFVSTGSRFVVASIDQDTLRIESFGEAHVDEEPPVSCLTYSWPAALVRLPRPGAGSIAVVTRAPDADDPTCTKLEGGILAIDRYDASADPAAPMTHTTVARIPMAKSIFSIVATDASSGAWVLLRLDTGEYFALPLDADGAPIGAPIETPPLSNYTVAIASRGDDLAIMTADYAGDQGNSDAQLVLIRRDGSLGPSARFSVVGTTIFDTSVFADPAGRGFLVGYGPSWADRSGYTRVRCE